MSAATKLPPEREQALHQRVADMLAAILGPAGTTNRDGVLWLTIEQAEPHAGARIERARRGVVAGVPDLQIVARRLTHWVELKRNSYRARASDAQLDLHVELAKAGCPSAICRTCAEVLAALAAWRIPHRRIVLTGAA